VSLGGDRPPRGRNAGLYPEIDPSTHGALNVGGGHRIYWECCGAAEGKPAVVLHGGPGSGATPTFRRFFDPSAYRVVLFDQRGSGRSTPHAGAATADLSTNTTHHLIADIEKLRDHLGVERWLVFGGSWGSTLALAYAERFPERVSELVLFSIVTTTTREVQWITRDAGRFFPAEWSRFRAGVPAEARDGNLADAYSVLLHSTSAEVRERAARDWCRWEDVHVRITPASRPNPRYEDPVFRLAFARLVTHYWRHHAWLVDGSLLEQADRLTGIPGVLVHGRLDLSGPPDIAWRLSEAWPDSELILIELGGHGLDRPETIEALVGATDRFRDRSGQSEARSE
jgi:proline iminopeptidase